MKRIWVVLAICCWMTTLMGGTASAKPEAGLIGPGGFFMGKTFAAGCPLTGLGVPVGNGKPSLANGWGPKNGSWLISAPIATVPNGLGHMHACGLQTRVAGLGSSCEWSKGYGGQGTLNWKTKAPTLLVNLGWKVNAGGVLPIIGNALDGAGGVGTFVALTTKGCDFDQFGPNGDKNGTTVGAFSILPGMVFDWNDLTDPIDPKEEGGIWDEKK